MKIMDSWVIKHDVGTRRETNILKVSLTIANMDGREIISKDDVLEAISYSKHSDWLLNKEGCHE